MNPPRDIILRILPWSLQQMTNTISMLQWDDSDESNQKADLMIVAI